ncbi:MAG TPA: hypothetical protein VHM70_30990 [Polyangiaceae bacterium]|jgi:hypothetical protein|nr:hypothetical protein [Polyangiaceae bacterium]
MNRQGVEVLRDEGGAIEIGWAAPGIFLACFGGELSASLGAAFAARFLQVVSDARTLEYFGDGSGMSSYDLGARSSFVRIVLQHRKKFSSFTVLTWRDGLSDATRGLVSAIGEPVTLLTDRSEFEAQLLRKAPLARSRLGSRSDLQPLPAPATPPELRSTKHGLSRK